MAKELMEIGGFITEGAEIVNHDNTLSGNGTVDSPLGVVPGYNETVLWSGSFTGTTGANNYIRMSEPLSAFENIELVMGGNYKTHIKYDGNASDLQVFSPFVNAGQATIYAAMFRVSAGYQNIYCQGCLRFGITGANVSNYAAIKSREVGEVTVTKVIGINRKA